MDCEETTDIAIDTGRALQRQYWAFYWPLALNGIVMLLARHCQNGTLARYPDATRQLAVFALAQSTFFLFAASVGFLPQMANVLARSRQAHKVCVRFVMTVASVLSLPLMVLAFTGLGPLVLGWLYGIRGESLTDVVEYLRYLTPLVFVGALRNYLSGLLVQARRTGCVMVLNIILISSTIGILIAGYLLSWRVVQTLALAQVFSGLLHLVLSLVAYYLLYQFPDQPPAKPLAYRDVLAFFWPVSITSSMFSLSRPIIYFFVGRTALAEETTATLRVAFDCAMFFHLPINQFRHVFLTFGKDNLREVRRFMVRVLLPLMLVMIVVNATPLASLYLRHVLRIGSDILSMTLAALWVLCLIPLAATLRNYYHGIAMLERRTRSMALGAVMRNVAIATAGFALYRAGILNHNAAAGCLVMGFVVEALTVFVCIRRRHSAGVVQGN